MSTKKHKKTNNDEEEYRQLVQKQLHEDFQVSEFLYENPTQKYMRIHCRNNLDNYIQLYNELLCEKTRKKEKHMALVDTIHIRNNENMKLSIIEAKLESWEGDKDHFLNSYEEIKDAIKNQLDVEATLQKEIIQIKKSLNLMKGDTGHLVQRNESTMLLESKIIKAQIVAQDQFLKVNTAFSKDKEEIKERNDMQKKFHRNLRKLCGNENSNLKRMKQAYIDAMVKKNGLFTRLSKMEKTSHSVQEHGNYQKMMKLKKKNYQVSYCNLLKLNQIIQFHETMEDDRECMLLNRSKKFLLARTSLEIKAEKSELVETVSLAELEEAALKEYERLSQRLERNSKIYDLRTLRREECLAIYEKLQQKQYQMYSEYLRELEGDFQLSEEQFGSYKSIFRKYEHNLQTIYCYLKYIANTLPKNPNFFPKAFFKSCQHDPSRKFINTASNLSQTWPEQQCDIEKIYGANQAQQFISIFYLNCCELNFPFEPMKNQLVSSFFGHFQKKIKRWSEDLTDFWNNYEEERSRHPRITQRKRQTNKDSENSDQDSEEEINLYDEEKPSTFTRATTLRNDSRNDSNSEHKQDVHSQMETVAKRIQLLQDIDQNYYKMLKSTLQMEKQNTKKNYKFMRTFKRAKFNSKDQILEEKRYEASFSGLMKSQSENKSKSQYLKKKEMKKLERSLRKFPLLKMPNDGSRTEERKPSKKIEAKSKLTEFRLKKKPTLTFQTVRGDQQEAYSESEQGK